MRLPGHGQFTVETLAAHLESNGFAVTLEPQATATFGALGLFSLTGRPKPCRSIAGNSMAAGRICYDRAAMRTILIVAILASACGTGPRSGADAAKPRSRGGPRRGRECRGSTRGKSERGQPVIVLHGGPDFDQSYLLPEMDRLSDSFRLIYYDQRGRGKSAAAFGRRTSRSTPR